MSTPMKLGYWKIRGLAQPIRFLLEYLSIPYENEFYEVHQKDDGSWDASEWTSTKYDEKRGLVVPNLPYLLDGDTRLTQSTAILRHICRRYKPEMLGTTDLMQANVDMVLGCITDLRSSFVTLCYSNTTETIGAKLQEFQTSKAVPTLKDMCTFMGKSPYLAGDNITYVDFMLYDLVKGMSLAMPTLLNDPAIADLKGYVQRIESIPAIQKYINTEFVKSLAFNNKMAGWK